MPDQIRITADQVNIDAELIDTNTSNVVPDAPPISASARTWGLPGNELEDAQKAVELLDLDSWPPEQGFCLFFAPAPTRGDDENIPGSAVTIIGKFQGVTESLKQVPSAASVTTEAA